MRRRKRKSRCGSGKRHYRDHVAAVIALSRIAERDTTSKKIPVRAYRCPRCGDFHLTSKR